MDKSTSIDNRGLFKTPKSGIGISLKYENKLELVTRDISFNSASL